MANVNSSIESEPRTLKEEQLNLAREVAADAVQKLEPHEATIIFIERMTPVGGSIQKMKQISEKEDEVGRVLKETREIIEIPFNVWMMNQWKKEKQRKIKFHYYSSNEVMRKAIKRSDSAARGE
uniref:Uncharacterized protein n=1 Tax=Cannabis sativa TaxID=3483 RepID=A0A803NZ54_CANSA